MKKWMWTLSIVVLLLSVSYAVLNMGRQPEPFPASSRSKALLQVGPLQVLQHDEVFIDDSRPTNANRGYAGDKVRRLEGTIWHPSTKDGGPYPLVVYSHGFSSNREGGAYLAEQLASLGFVVAAVDYPLTSRGAPGGPNAKDVVNQPGDISFLIDRLLVQNNTPGHVLEGMLDGSRIGVTGISLGGMTTTLVSFHPEMRDPRIGAALSIAGPTALFTDTFFTFTQVPFLMLAGDIDALVPYLTNAAPVIDKVPGSQLVTVTGGSHTGFAGPAAPLRWMKNPDALGCYMANRNIDGDEEDTWYDLIGTEAQGIDHKTKNDFCLVDPLPKAINVLRQQMITSVVVTSFFQSVFAPKAEQREAARFFLSNTLAGELPDVSYRRAPSRKLGTDHD
ncbi:alpha/beta hydrolase family protein [Pseudohalioglobus lutimaris]|uniref:PET hydrolase/cutinase-like domain-containing protein n=1 Tax=Pseudohalioglobus lutimaris TaxID=1737061 RepID=A0A2N5X7U4_9GAMM|nr:hypothetical protein [Pseudohalioglobus lutimaris]PLW70557.1 hypothetical protein C0039_00025 [Pseudohalioglobus lutimaris]